MMDCPLHTIRNLEKEFVALLEVLGGRTERHNCVGSRFLSYSRRCALDGRPPPAQHL